MDYFLYYTCSLSTHITNGRVDFLLFFLVLILSFEVICTSVLWRTCFILMIVVGVYNCDELKISFNFSPELPIVSQRFIFPIKNATSLISLELLRITFDIFSNQKNSFTSQFYRRLLEKFLKLNSHPRYFDYILESFLERDELVCNLRATHLHSGL